MSFPFPVMRKIGNAVAKIFWQGTAHKPKLRHIDCHQEWVQTLRNRDLMTPVHVDTIKNDVAIFTEILDRIRFELVRNRTMVEYNCHQEE